MTVEKNKVEARQAAPRRTNRTALVGGVTLLIIGFGALLIYFVSTH